MKKNKTFQLVAAIFLLAQLSQFGMARVRNHVGIPDIPGYKTLKCDFHMHTIFSDGYVWPTVRTDEAWREGLDAIAITDHIEYLPHKDDVSTNLNRSYEIAKKSGDELNITVLSGGEITRGMPPGHLNGIFLKDANKLRVSKWRDAVKNAAEQGAFIFMNHPGWRGQQKDGVARWYDEHTELIDNNLLHGIEVVNGWEYYPQAHQWCLDKKLTMLSNSDVHNPINLDYQFHKGYHRPMTLVFAKDNSEESIKEALFDRRTVVYSRNMLVGEEKFLKPIFDNSVTIDENYLELEGTKSKYLQISNSSEIEFKLNLTKENDKISVPKYINLYGDKTVLFRVSAKSTNFVGTVNFELPYVVKNLKVGPKKELPVKIKFKVKFN